jgi:putative methyltransferase (TIGR04325 family)
MSMLTRFAKSPVETLFQVVRSARGRFRGVFETYEAAELAIPKGRLVGYDHPEAAKIYIHHMSKARDSDYPVIFWLGRALREAHSVFDCGGNIGVTYYKFGHYLDFPAGLRWLICDLPEITKAGEEIAMERGAPLSFTTRLDEGEGCEILLGIGAIQYIQKPLAQSLAEWRQKPKHILINRIPLYEGPMFVTLDNVGPVVCAYQVFNRQQFVTSICEIGYDLVDSWSTPELSCIIRWHASHSFTAHSGLYFRAR